MEEQKLEQRVESAPKIIDAVNSKIKKILRKYNYWSNNDYNKLVLTNSYTSCRHCGDSCHVDGSCGGDGD